MLYCTSCIRYLRTIFADTLSPWPTPPLASISTSASRLRIPPPGFLRSHTSQTVQHQYPRGHGSVTVHKLADQNAPTTGSSPAEAMFMQRDLEKELLWLKDPMKLAESTARRLEKDDHHKAIALVRLASRNMSCTVSWNHLVNYELACGRVTAAVKVYNEMKKRAQIPDAHTYTILFRGLARHTHFSQSLPRALSIYHSMFATGSPVEPSIIHSNAVLKVCALAGDMDALFGVAAKLTSHGKGSANSLTYTIILNAIRSQAWQDRTDRGLSSTFQEKHQTTNRAVLQARRLWEEIRDRWSNGDMRIDEEVVCAMGRVLLLSGTERDIDDILSLLEQTMGIPRQVLPIGDPMRLRPSREQEGLVQPETIESDPQSSQPTRELTSPAARYPQNGSSLGSQQYSHSTDTSPFAPLSRRIPKSFFPRPGQNTLSLAMDTCTRMRLPRPAQDYWGLLTSADKYNILPDSENYHMYLRLLRLKRASKMALEMVEEMRAGHIKMGGSRETGGLQIKTFRIAMSCCVRDKMNRNAINHASKLVRMMMDTCESPDAKVLHMYLTLALSQTPRDWRTLMGVIRGTELGVRNLRSLLAYDPESEMKTDKDQVLELVRSLIGAYDIVRELGREEMSQEERVRVREQRYTLEQWMKRVHGRRRVRENAKPKAERSLGREETSPQTDLLRPDGEGIDEEPQGETEKSETTMHISDARARLDNLDDIPAYDNSVGEQQSRGSRYRGSYAPNRADEDGASRKDLLRSRKRKERRFKEKRARTERLEEARTLENRNI